LGYIQAKLLGKKLANINFDEIIISDQKRTRLTANEIFNEKKKLNACGDEENCKNSNENVNVTYSEQIRERCFGILEGKYSSFYQQILEKKNIPERKFKPLGGESKFDLFRRARKFMYNLLTEGVKVDYVERLTISLDARIKTMLKNFRNKFESETLTEEQEKELQAMESDLKADREFLLEDIKNEVMNIEVEQSSEESNVDNLKEEITFDDNFDKEEIDKYLETIDVDYLKEKPYISFDNNEKIKRVLLVTHSSIAKEILNVLKKLQGRRITTQHSVNNTGIYVIRIYCRFCGMQKCQSKTECDINRLEFDYVLVNDISHLKILK
jgi:broad specificity phosphatase PhoE